MKNLIYVLIYFLFLVLNDSLFYGVYKEHLIQGSNYGRGIFYSKFWDWLFYKFEKCIRWLMTELPQPQKIFIIKIDCNYRWALQKPLEIGLLIFFFWLSNWNIPLVLGILLAHYFLSFDFGYCIILGQNYLLHQPKQWKPSWLMYPFQIGYWLFKNYSYKKYMWSAIIGFLIMNILSLIIWTL